MKMKITEQSHMSQKEIRANMCAPCPLCGKMEMPIRVKRTIFGNDIFYYECSDSTYVLNMTLHEITRFYVNGCGATWNIKINPKTELFNRLTHDEVEILNQKGKVDKTKLEKVWDKNREFWKMRYTVKGGCKYEK